MNTSDRQVALKVGIYHPRFPQHTRIEFVKAIIDNFDKVSKIFLVESDNYCGKSLDRLQIYNALYSERVVPFSLSDDPNAVDMELAGQRMGLSPVLFKPNVFVDTHIMRTMSRGSILKNLFGCIPEAKKARYHKSEIFCPLLVDVYEKTGGVDLAVLDGTYLFRTGHELSIPVNTLIVGRDAVAVEVVGMLLAGLKPEKNPVIREFTRRGLGESNFDNIMILGESFESTKVKFKEAVKTLNKKWREAGGAHKSWASSIDNLIRDGFFKLLNKRTRDEVMKALKTKGLRVKGNTGVIATTLSRRMKKGKLKGLRDSAGWIYWTE